MRCIVDARSNEAWRTIKNVRDNNKNKCKLEIITTSKWKKYY